MKTWTMWHVLACVGLCEAWGDEAWTWPGGRHHYRVCHLMLATVGAGWPSVRVDPPVRVVGGV